MSESALLLVVLIALAAIAFLLPQMLVRSAVPKVIAVLREHGATNADGAAAPADLGLVEMTVWERAFKRRDFRPKALSGLIQIGVVRRDAEGKVYLNEFRLSETVWKDS